MEQRPAKTTEVIPGGIYRHYKGNLYKVLEVARHSETEDLMVVYQALYGDYGFWVRPLEMFAETLEISGVKVKRFAQVSNGVAQDPWVRMMADPSPALYPAPDLFQLVLDPQGQRRFGIMLTPGGRGPFPTLLFLHGFPGNERNFDLAHAVRRLGFNVMIFHYRGTWGSDGSFTFENALEDIRVALSYLRSKEAVAEFDVDTERLFIAGNSFGGFAAILTAQEDLGIRGCVALSVYDLGRMASRIPEDKALETGMINMFEACVQPTRGGSAAALTREVHEHREGWNLDAGAPRLEGRPVLLLAGSRDTDGPPELHYAPLREALAAAGVSLEAHLLDSDHGFQNKRLEVACLIGRFLERWIDSPAKEVD